MRGEHPLGVADARRRAPLFASLAADELEELARAAHRRRLAAGGAAFR